MFYVLTISMTGTYLDNNKVSRNYRKLFPFAEKFYIIQQSLELFHEFLNNGDGKSQVWSETQKKRGTLGFMGEKLTSVKCEQNKGTPHVMKTYEKDKLFLHQSTFLIKSLESGLRKSSTTHFPPRQRQPPST